jgi:single-strand DNA-binding protein
MSDINTVIISGRLARDPELRHTPGGLAIAEITIVSERKYKDSSGEYKEKASFIGCTVFGPTAEFASKWLRKGKRANVQGELNQEEWTDKETGKKRSKTKVKVLQIQPIDWPDKDEQQQQAPPPPDASRNAQAQPTDDDDVPF